jgi:hypothetical protein
VRRLGFTVALALGACAAPQTPSTTATADSVRTFAESVARGVSERGPAAWRDYFADTSAFFMA